MTETQSYPALVGLLADHRPDDLAALAAMYPDEAKQLQPGRVLGGGMRSSRLALARRALSVASDRLEPNLARLRQRLSAAKRLRLIGAIVALILSTGVIVALLQDEKWIAVATAAVNLASGVLVLISNHLETVPHGSEKASDVMAQLVTLIVDSERLRSRIETMDDDDPAAAAVLDKANDVIAHLRALELKLFGGGT